MQAIDWKSQTTPEQRKEIIPTTMTYRYKRDKKDTKYKARCSIRGDRMTPHIHYDPEKTATYMADRTTVRTMFAIAASMNMKIEHFDITGAYLHEEYKHTKKVFIWQPPRFNRQYKCSITAGARTEVKTGTALYGAHVGGCAHVWPARARTVA